MKFKENTVKTVTKLHILLEFMGRMGQDEATLSALMIGLHAGLTYPGSAAQFAKDIMVVNPMDDATKKELDNIVVTLLTNRE